MIAIRALGKQFGGHEVLRHVTFEAANGRITTLLGANGAGKTTILRAVTGLLRPTSGAVEIDGIDVTLEPRRARGHVGVVADHFGLYPFLTAREHLELAGRLRGIAERDLGTHIDAVSEALRINPFAHTAGRHLSQGQAMRIAVARAVVGSPANVVMDEPTRGLDITGVRMLRQLLFDLRAAGKAVLITNHSMMEVEEVSDHLVVLARGRVAAAGAPAELRRLGGRASLEENVVALGQLEGEG